MKAAILDKVGSPLRLGELDKPALRAGEVVIRLAASALNPLDGKIRSGAAPMRARICRRCSASTARALWWRWARV